jgi:hypothetical protein
MVWPDATPDWRNVDEYPDSHARNAAREVYERASKLDATAMGATKGQFDMVPTFGMSEHAHGEFLDWRTDLERRVRSDALSPALEGHLAKYRKLVPALALINHIADAGSNEVSGGAMLRALAYANYLESHARRVYLSGSEGEVGAAKELPPIETAADAATASSALVAAVAAGELTPTEAAELGRLVENYVRALESTNFEQRLIELEKKANEGS